MTFLDDDPENAEFWDGLGGYTEVKYQQPCNKDKKLKRIRYIGMYLCARIISVGRTLDVVHASEEGAHEAGTSPLHTYVPFANESPDKFACPGLSTIHKNTRSIVRI